MTSELRPAMQVWREAFETWAGEPEHDNAPEAAAAVIEADREAVRAEVVRDIVAWLRNDEEPYPDSYDIADEIDDKFGERAD